MKGKRGRAQGKKEREKVSDKVSDGDRGRARPPD